MNLKENNMKNNQIIREQEELKEFNLRNAAKKFAPALVGASLAGGVLGVVGPHIRNATTAVHKAIGDPVGGAGVSTARADAANKVGLFGSDVPAGQRALNGAVGGGGLFGALTAANALAAAIKKRRRKSSEPLKEYYKQRLLNNLNEGRGPKPMVKVEKVKDASPGNENIRKEADRIKSDGQKDLKILRNKK